VPPARIMPFIFYHPVNIFFERMVLKYLNDVVQSVFHIDFECIGTQMSRIGRISTDFFCYPCKSVPSVESVFDFECILVF
jgi:hypothetical protein